MSEEQKARPGVFLTVPGQPVLCECGVLFEEVIRATLREPAVESSHPMRLARLADEKFLVDSVLFAWLDDELIDLASGKRYSHPKKLLLRCGSELSRYSIARGERKVAGTMLGLREIERLLFADGRK